MAQRAARDRWRRVALPGGAAVLAGVLLLGAGDLGLRLPALRVFGAQRGSAVPHSAHTEGSFVPLSDAYLQRLFGVSGFTPAEEPNSTLPGNGAAEAGASPTARGAAAVVHPFTNDDFADAVTMRTVPFTGRTTMRGASRQPGEPDACASAGGTAWYRYVATSADALRADTFGTPGLTDLGVFAGTSLSGLSLIGCGSSVRGGAQVAFVPRPGSTYYVQITAPVDGPLVVHLAAIGGTSLVSVYSDGEEQGAGGALPSISGDGSVVTFQSGSRDLDPDHRAEVDGEYLYARDRSRGVTQMQSVSSAGEVADNLTSVSSLSADGRYVAFQSSAHNLVGGDDNQLADIFVRDRWEGRTTIASVSSSGHLARNPGTPWVGWRGSLAPHISADGGFVAFDSNAPDLAGSTSCTPAGCYRALIHETATGRTLPVALVGTGPEEAAGESNASEVTPGGRFVVFSSPAPNLPGANGLWQIYVRDRLRRTTTLVSVNDAGEAATANTGGPNTSDFREFGAVTADISDDGRYVSFLSAAPNLVPGDTNVLIDAFVHDLRTHQTRRVSVTSSGAQGTGDPDNDPRLQRSTALSADGRFVVFDTLASDLAPGDTDTDPDVYVHDRVTGATLLASVDSAGQQLYGRSYYPAISGDGSVVCFTSELSSGRKGVYVHEIPRPPP